MQVKMIAARDVTMSALSTKTYPADWIGEVPDEIARRWISEGVAADLTPTAATPAFTLAETAALKAAAGAIIAAAEDAGAEDPVENDIALEDLTLAELRELADQAGLDVPPRAKKAELVVILQVHATAEDQKPDAA